MISYKGKQAHLFFQSASLIVTHIQMNEVRIEEAELIRCLDLRNLVCTQWLIHIYIYIWGLYDIACFLNPSYDMVLLVYSWQGR